MTNSTFSPHPAGRELDAAVGEALRLPKLAKWEGYTATYYWPEYSTDIAVAWPLFIGKKWVLQEVEPDKWNIYEDWRAYEDGRELAEASTAPLAICYALLATLPDPS